MKSAYIQVLKRENELFDQITNKTKYVRQVNNSTQFYFDGNSVF